MAEIDIYQSIGIVLSIIGPLSAVILANGYYARRFEKQKRKYEVKLERYSLVFRYLNILGYLSEVFKERRKAFVVLMETKSDYADEEIKMIDMRISSAWAYLGLVKSSLGFEDTEHFSHIFNRVEEESESSSQDRWEESNSRFNELTKSAFICYERTITKLSEAISDISIIGRPDLGVRIGDIRERLMVQIGRVLDGSEDWTESFNEEIGFLIAAVSADLEKDLEKTL